MHLPKIISNISMLTVNDKRASIDEMDGVSWSALPPDLVRSIAEHLETRTDITQFRAVCPTWRSSIPSSLLNSRNILSPFFPYKGTSHSSVLVASSVFLLKSAVNPELRPWLITVEEFNPGKLYVRAPLSRVVTKDFPVRSLHTLNLSDFHLQEMGRFYTLRSVGKTDEDMFSEKRLTTYYNKVVLFVNPNCVETCPTIDDCTVIELYDHVDYLTVTRLKNGEKRQVSFNRREFDDIVNFKGKIYAIDYQGKLCSMHYHSLKMSSVIEDPLDGVSRSNYKKRFAVTCGELYLVYRRCQISDSDATFKIYKLNEEMLRWDEEVEGVGDDRILFVTFDGCFFASVEDFPRWKGNCIVFRRGSFLEYSGIGDFDSRIFQQTWNIHLDIAVFFFEDGDCVSVETYPGYSDVFWPPPSWLWTNVHQVGEINEPQLIKKKPPMKIAKSKMA